MGFFSTKDTKGGETKAEAEGEAWSGTHRAMEYLKFSDGRTEEDLPRPKLDLCSKNSPEPQDVTIICDKEEVLARKCVLVSSSGYVCWS